MRTRLLTAAMVLGLLAGDVSGQKANFSSESQVVVLHVAVRDKKGYVSGLEQKAFRVLENKQRQAVSFSAARTRPSRRAFSSTAAEAWAPIATA